MTTVTGRAAETEETSGLAPGGALGRKFLKRALQFSFLFFLLKGLAWLAVGFLAWRGLT
jgi:hypothetical protein